MQERFFMENIKNHSLQIEYGQGMIAGGVAEVVGFNEREIRFKTDSGVKVVVLGDNLKINRTYFTYIVAKLVFLYK